MARKDLRRPTNAELEILRVVWSRGSCTVREVFETLEQSRDAGHTTVLKLMQIMVDKGLLRRDELVRPQIYRAVQTQRQTQRQLLRDLAERAFGGSPGNLVLQALSSKKTTAEERRQIREMLEKLEKEADS